MPLHQLVQHAGSRVHIDSGRPAPSHRPQYIVGQHLGGGEIGCRPKGAPHRAVSEESALSSGTARSANRRDELEGALLHLIGRGKLSRIDHDIARGHITMGQAALNIGHTSQKIEQSRPMRATVSGESRPSSSTARARAASFERDPLHPFHHDDRILTDAAASVEAGEAAQRGQGAMGVVFGIECGSTGLGEPIVRSLAIRLSQTFECEPLATGDCEHGTLPLHRLGGRRPRPPAA